MVENSLGRLWYEGYPDFDKSQWKYYLDEAEQEPEVEAQLQKIRAEYSSIRPEEMGNNLSNYTKKCFPDAKTDLFAVFIEKCRIRMMLKEKGYQSMITQHAWMFLSKYVKLRERVISTSTIINMAHLGPRAFEDIAGEVVQTTAFVTRKIKMGQYKGTYARLVDGTSQEEKENLFLSGSERFVSCQDSFESIPDSLIGYHLTMYFTSSDYCP